MYLRLFYLLISELLYSIHYFREKYRNSFRLWLGPQLWVFLHTPQETREALNDPTLKRADTFQLLNVFIGNGLLISEGNILKWETQCILSIKILINF